MGFGIPNLGRRRTGGSVAARISPVAVGDTSIGGTGTAGATLTVTKGGSALGSATVQSNGTWTLALGSAAAVGDVYAVSTVAVAGTASITVYGAIGPTTTSYSTSAAAGTNVATFTGLSGRTATGISPNDGRLAIAGSGTTLVVGMTAATAGTTNYTVSFSDGSTLSLAVTASGGSVTLGPLTLSVTSGTVGTAFNATVSGKTAGSTLALSGAGSAGLSISGTTISGTPTAAGSVDLVETLAGATNTPRTTSGAATVTAAASTLRIVGNLTRMHYAADVTTSGNEVREQRLPSYLGRQDANEIWLVFCNWWCDLGAGGNETNTGNAVKLTMALEYNGVTVQAPNASLASPATVADGATFEAGPFKPSDFGATVFTNQSQIFHRVRCEVNVGEKIPRAGQIGSGAPASRKWRASGDASQIGNTGVFTDAVVGNTGPACNLVVGKTAVNELAVLTLNDSIGEGNSDTQSVTVGNGYIDRAFDNVGGKKVPVAHAGRHGGTLSRLVLNGQTKRIALAKYASHVFIALGANDLFTATNYMTNFQANYRTVAAALKAVNSNVKIYGFTVAPRTLSNDKFTTSAGQIDQVNWDDAAIKTGANDFLTTLVGDGTLAGVFDVNQSWGVSGGNAKWVSNGTDWYAIPVTGDGPGGTITVPAGTITSATNSTTVTGSGTTFTTSAAVGNFIYRGTAGSATYLGRIASIQSDTSLTLEANAAQASTAQTFTIADRIAGTHPGPALNITAGTALATFVAGLAA